MDFTLKTTEIKKTTSKIVLDRLNVDNDQDLKALFILLGGYNEFGRKIPLETHRKNMIVFKDLIDKVSKEL